MFCSLSNRHGWKVSQADITRAFLHSNIGRKVYIEALDGIQCYRSNVIWKLNKDIYGLPTAAKAWNNLVDESMEAYGLKRLPSKPCIYIYNDHRLIVLIYVDNVSAFSNSQEVIDSFYSYLKSKVDLRVIGKLTKF